jgi:hypothetical protein
LIVELKASSQRAFSLFQATWPEVSVNHATLSECLVNDDKVIVGAAESEEGCPALSSNRFVRIYFVYNGLEESMASVYVNGDQVLSTSSLPSGGPKEGSRFAVDRRGLLLFASNSASYMPGGIELKRVEFHTRCFDGDEIQAHASQRWSFRGAAVSAALRRSHGQLALSRIDKKPQPIWSDLSFLAHFCDPYMDIGSGEIYRSAQVLHLGLEKLAASPAGSASPEEVDVTKRLKDVFEGCLDLFRKFQRTRADVDPYDDYADLTGVLPFLKRLRRALQSVEVGGATIIPGGWGCGEWMEPRQHICFVVDRPGEDRYRLAVFGFGPSREYHPKTAVMPPKIKYRPIVIDDLPAAKIQDEAWWSLLTATNLPDAGDSMTSPSLTYDFFLPWLAGRPLDVVRESSERKPSSATSDAGLDWRTPTYGRDTNNFHRCLVDALHYLARRWGLSRPHTKLLKYHLRQSFLDMAIGDVKAVLDLPAPDKTLIRMTCQQLAFTGCKLSRLEVTPGTPLLDSTSLRNLKTKLDEVEEKLLQKTSGESTLDAKPPLLDLDTGDGAPHSALGAGKAVSRGDTQGLFPFFERFVREELEGKEGSAVDTTQLPAVNFDLLPTRVRSLNEVTSVLKITDVLLAQLDNLSTPLRFAHFLKIALVQHVFTRLIPLPLGPVSLRRVVFKIPFGVWMPRLISR